MTHKAFTNNYKFELTHTQAWRQGTSRGSPHHHSRGQLWVGLQVGCWRNINRVGRIYTPYMTVYLVISLPKNRIYTVYIWFWPTLNINGVHTHTHTNHTRTYIRKSNTLHPQAQSCRQHVGGLGRRGSQWQQWLSSRICDSCCDGTHIFR